MSKPLEKSEEKIARDKEALKALVGAKANMEAALRRNELLERTLIVVRRELKIAAETYGDHIHLKVYNSRSSTWEVVKASEFFARIDDAIKAVL